MSPHDALPGKDLSLNDLAEQLRLIYCGPMAIEFMHINVRVFCLLLTASNLFFKLAVFLWNLSQNWEERQWLAQNFENTVADELLNEDRIKLAKLMLKCEVSIYLWLKTDGS